MNKNLLFFLLASLLSGCYYDNASELNPAIGTGVCDTVNPTYNGKVSEIFQNSCGTNNSCHSTSVAENGVILDTYSSAIQVDEIILQGVIEQDNGFLPMPPTGKLNDCNIAIIKNWIQAGKPQ